MPGLRERRADRRGVMVAVVSVVVALGAATGTLSALAVRDAERARRPGR
ncbi:hypothetical protein [Streptomyces sp. NBC_01235]|nr:hypothetical protein OG289_10710 [Streptomyces sp. NBC_01235]